MVKCEAKSLVAFHINGKKQTVDSGSGIGPNTRLVDYIRDVANLKGTKVMCREGGCGACTITAKVIDPETGFEIIKSVNSCLTPVLSCDGWDISTVESLGNKHEGYHVVQNRLVNFYGTQCGYCTPGMVMNMHSLLESKKTVGVEDVEKNLDGNICRCTGYRPILDAFKSLAQDAPSELKQRCADIEDCATCPLRKSGQLSSGQAKASSSIQLELGTGEEWISAKTLEAALTEVVRSSTGVRFVAGNTSTGIFKDEGPYRKFVDINGIVELKRRSVDNTGITFGGLTTLSDAISLFCESAKLSGLEYGTRVASHLERVANTSVRNNGTIAGNLMIKHKHRGFPSDVFVILESLAATITLVSAKCKKSLIGSSEKVIVEELKPLSMLEFLATDMSTKLIKSIHLPKHENCYYRSFKITRRYQNAHAYVNAGLLLKVNENGGDFIVEGRPRLVFGGISPSFIHASATEAILQGMNLGDENTLKIALETIEKEVEPEGGPLESSPEYRIQLAKSLLYKTILEIVGDKTQDNFKSGAEDIIRNVSSSKQFIDTDPADTTLYKSVPKYEGGIQVSGEAEYTGDIPFRPDELFAAFVMSTVGCAELKGMDPSKALELPGVEKFITAKDIPGENDTVKNFFFSPYAVVEPVFATDKIQFYGQPLGLILATSPELANKAAKLVEIEYDNVQKPVVTIDDAIAKAKSEGTFPIQTYGLYKTEPVESIQVAHTLKGEIGCGSQYHFYMETHITICHPREDGIDVYCSTQAVDFAQNAIAKALAIPTNSINMQVRRLGGGFGGKTTTVNISAIACAVATWLTNRPVRLLLNLETCMTILGKRHPYRIPYEVGFDDAGRIGSLKVDFVGDTGWSSNEANPTMCMIHVQGPYKAAGWEINTHFVKTNTPSNTFCRAPGSVKAVAVVEWIMDRIASHLHLDLISVRMANMLETGDRMLSAFGPPTYERVNQIPEMFETMKKTSDYEERKAAILKFNRENRWKKRGLSVVPVRYGISYWLTNVPTSVAIYHMDGHVAISHGGVEMGNGINTKLVQNVAFALGIPIDRIKVKPTNNFVAANASITAGSITSEIACYSIMRACEEIRENLRPILEKLENPSWEQLIKEAHSAKVKLTASYTPTAKDEFEGYDVWVLNLTEVEIDVLTGEYKILRTDLYEDTGKSLSPGQDLGQIEGGYIHGQGYWTTEKIVHDEATGKLLTNGTWDYKVPESKDLPEDFRVTLLSNTPNPHGVLRSKATGEPSTDAAFAVVLAMRSAIASARENAGNTEWFDMTGPVTPEDIALLCLTTTSHLTL